MKKLHTLLFALTIALLGPVAFAQQQTINIGSVANDGTGDNLRTAGGKMNSNFTELYNRTAVLGTTTDDAIPVGTGSAFALKTIPSCTDTSGNHLNYNASTNTFSCGTSDSHVGTVTSVAVTVPSVLSVTGSPLTTSGTLAIDFATGQTQNRVLASPNSSSGAVALRALVGNDIPNIALGTVNTNGGITGTLGVGNGGTGNTSATDDTVLVANGTGYDPKAVPNCTDTGGNHLNYTASTNSFSCGTSGDGGAGAPTQTTGSFTITWDDACSSSPTQTVNWVKNGNIVTWRFLGFSSCTSDSTNFKATGTPVPAALRPAVDITIGPFDVLDNGVRDGGGCMRIFNSGGGNAGNVDVLRTTSGTTFSCDNAVWTGSGNKRIAIGNSLSTQASFTYLVN